MATLTAEQIEQKKQLLVEKAKQMKAIYDELVEAGAIELSEEELDGVAGGTDHRPQWLKDVTASVDSWLKDNPISSFFNDLFGSL
ncbi:MAG: hypothetical protein K5945_04775 [Bacteroidaceae bacterium]|nr:hypothetical protein [Bacteroidaceae bacterium]